MQTVTLTIDETTIYEYDERCRREWDVRCRELARTSKASVELVTWDGIVMEAYEYTAAYECTRCGNDCAGECHATSGMSHF